MGFVFCKDKWAKRVDCVCSQCTADPTIQNSNKFNMNHIMKEGKKKRRKEKEKKTTK